MKLLALGCTIMGRLDRGLDALQPLLLLGLRLWVAKVFFMSGLTKIQSWQSTVALFRYEYTVPLLPPAPAAWLATVTELGIPVLLVLGLVGRPAALVLLVFNFVALYSYPDISPAGVKDHWLWGMMLLVVVVFGPGRLSLDHLIGKRYGAPHP